MENKVSLIIVACLVIFGACFGAYKIGNSRGYENGNAHATKIAKDKVPEHLLVSLRVCINQAATAEAQTSCFRQAHKGILPNPTLDELNALPALY